MIKQLNLLNDVAQEYHIPRGNNETELNWKCRVAYSLLGQAGYASLWDTLDEMDLDGQKLSSIVHFKRRIEKTLLGLLTIYPDLSGIYTSEFDKVSKELYYIMTSSGYVYHAPYRLSPPVYRQAIGNRCRYIRGHEITEKRFVSGTGCYMPRGSVNLENAASVAEMFDFPTETPKETWDRITKDIHWVTAFDESQYQALITKPPFFGSPWQDRLADKDVSLARTRADGEKLYYLYKRENGNLLLSASHLPDWMVGDEKRKEYRTISNACLAARGVLPATSYSIDGEIVYLHIGYIYPPSIMCFVLLYSWPKHYLDWPQNFQRIMSTNVFEDFKEVLESYGYRFKEA